MAFRVGQKVTLIDNDAWDTDDGEAFPEYGKVYTVRGFDEPEPEGDYIFLVEIVNEPLEYVEAHGEASFFAGAFRPVVEQSTETGMATLRKVADDASKTRELIIGA